jgi:Rieske Fe-S protein
LRENTECILNSEYYIHGNDFLIAMKKPHLPPTPCQGCAGNTSCSDLDRRQVLQILGLATSLPFIASNASAQATPLLLVDADAEQDFAPLRPSDLKVAKPLLAFPFDTQTGKPKNESRANKLVLIRLPEDQMEAATKGRSAGGVLAYSALCTHQACDVKTWIAKEKVLVCFCHASKFDLLDGAKVVDGPASRPLPSFSLKLDGEFLAIAPSSPANQSS